MIKKILLTFILAALCITLLCSCIPKQKGEFFTLQDAYEQGFISKDELMSIAYYHNGGNKGITNESYIRTPKSPEALSIDTENAIKETKAYYLRRKSLAGLSAKKAKADDVEIINYYGTYNNYSAIMMIDTYTVYDESLWEIEIDGVKFFYNDGNRIFVWKQLI